MLISSFPGLGKGDAQIMRGVVYYAEEDFTELVERNVLYVVVKVFDVDAVGRLRVEVRRLVVHDQGLLEGAPDQGEVLQVTAVV